MLKRTSGPCPTRRLVPATGTSLSLSLAVGAIWVGPAARPWPSDPGSGREAAGSGDVGAAGPAVAAGADEPAGWAAGSAGRGAWKGHKRAATGTAAATATRPASRRPRLVS